MRISFQHANPSAGNESFLLRFDRPDGPADCLLVDAGRGVVAEELVGSDDRLVAIGLTHAHVDHYAELASVHRADVPILTGPATAQILDDVLSIASTEYDVSTPEAVLSAITPVSQWVDIAPGIALRPIPAGHTPGAVGFLIRVTDGKRSHQLLVTGDFTCRRAGGYPGFPAGSFADTDVLFLTGAINDTFESSLTGGLTVALEQATSGSPTLVTTSGLVGVQVAYLLSVLAHEFDRRVPIRLVGQVAKLYEALDYSCRDVTTIPYFSSTSQCLAPGTITIAGPEIPRERSSGRLFDVLQDDTNACVVQLVGSGKPPITDGACTIHEYELVNHPTRDTLVTVHDAIDPVHTVITHCHGGAYDAFNDLSSVVWGSGDTAEYTLYDGRRWRLPEWMGGGKMRHSSSRNVQQFAGDVFDSLPVPPIDRHDDPQLRAEGLDIETISQRLHQQPTSTQLSERHAQPAPTDEHSDSTATPQMTARNNDTGSSSSSNRKRRPPDGLVDSIRPNLGDRPDPHLRVVLDEQAPSVAGMAADLPAQASAGEQSPSVASDERPTTSNADDSSNGQSTAEPSTAEQTDTDSESADDDTSGATEPTDTMTVTLHPLVVGALRQSIATDASEFDSFEAAIVSAVDQYVLALLGGHVAGTDPPQLSVTVTGSEQFDRVLESFVAADDRFESVSELVLAGITSVVGTDSDEQRSIEGLGAYRQQLSAIVSNDNNDFEAIADVIEAAIVTFGIEIESEPDGI